MTHRKTLWMVWIVACFVTAGSAAAQACKDNGNCPDRSQFCKKEPGDCDGKGECSRRPEACTDVFDPVCGCDGRTYGNACYANMAGVNVDHEGECKAADCESNRDCERGEFCHKRTGDCDGRGRCQERPEVCPRIFDPVCGCDGKTYSNSCAAAAAGVSVAHEGECRADVCESNRDCDRDDFCQKRTGDCDGEGRCQTRPELCPQIFDPVCGCDRKTYSNSCFAAVAGVSVASLAPCEEAPKTE